jgi:CubicO group peptidase (beta-lactamase class C family)
MRKLLKVLKVLSIGFIALVVALSLFLKVVHYPNIVASLKLGLAPASKTPTLMPWHTIAPSAKPIPLATSSEKLPATVDFRGKQVTWQQFLDLTNTNAYLIMRNGVITYEYYNAKNKITASSQLPSYSMAKTMTSLVIGQLIAQGKIKESEKFVDFFPQWKTGTSFDQVTIQSLLDMESGVGVSDNYPSGPSGWGVGIAQMYATTDMNWFISHNRKMFEAPDTKPEYRSVNTQLLGLIIQKVLGTTVSAYFQKNIWQPVGTEFAATWNVDHVGGHEKTFCCFNASARDYARIGLMLNNSGQVAEKQIIPTAWIKRISTPVVTLDYGWKYGAQVWHPYPGINLAMGLHGQQIFMDPATRTVIVKLSDDPTSDTHQVDAAKVAYALAQSRK